MKNQKDLESLNQMYEEINDVLWGTNKEVDLLAYEDDFEESFSSDNIPQIDLEEVA